MKRWIAYAAALALLLVLPDGGTDVARLQPMELLYIYIEEGVLTVKTDTGDLGIGEDLNAAFTDLKETTPGEVFLDTAAYLLLTEETLQYTSELQNVLKSSTRVCLAEGITDLKEASQFLSAHKPQTRLKDCNGEHLDLLVLQQKGTRLSLMKKDEKSEK